MVAKIGEQVNFKGIPYYLDQLNTFVRKFSKEFNEVHKTGVDLDGNQGEDFLMVLIRPQVRTISSRCLELRMKAATK